MAATAASPARSALVAPHAPPVQHCLGHPCPSFLILSLKHSPLVSSRSPRLITHSIAACTTAAHGPLLLLLLPALFRHCCVLGRILGRASPCMSSAMAAGCRTVGWRNDSSGSLGGTVKLSLDRRQSHLQNKYQPAGGCGGSDDSAGVLWARLLASARCSSIAHQNTRPRVTACFACALPPNRSIKFMASMPPPLASSRPSDTLPRVVSRKLHQVRSQGAVALARAAGQAGAGRLKRHSIERCDCIETCQNDSKQPVRRSKQPSPARDHPAFGAHWVSAYPGIVKRKHEKEENTPGSIFCHAWPWPAVTAGCSWTLQRFIETRP